MLININQIVDEAAKTFKRFPVELIIAIIGSFSMMLLIESDHPDEKYHLVNAVHTCLLGLAFMLSISVYAERNKLSAKFSYGIKAVGIVLLVAYYIYLPDKDLHLSYIIRAVLLFLAFHLAVSFIPFLRKGELLGFWEYNKQLFVNFLTAALYSGVLYAGLALALVAINALFNADIDEKLYAHLWFLLAGVFNTWFFLSKYPENYETLSDNIEYPKGLKLFTQYVLLPLVAVYLIILYLYEVKIILDGELPVGWVSYLILAFSVVGILALLLVYPLQNNSKHKWVNIFTKGFYWALFPLIALFFVGVGKRIFDYGITENRYFLLILAFWLLGISIYLLVKKLKEIKIIPMSLAILSLMATVGPWSAFSVSEISQQVRLENILKENNLLENGKIKPAEDTLKFEAQKEISSIVDYLVEMHGYMSLSDFFEQPMEEIIDSTVSNYSQSNIILKAMNLKYVNPWESSTQKSSYYSFNSTHNSYLSVKGYQYLIPFNHYNYSGDKISEMEYEEIGAKVELNFKEKQLLIGYDSTEISLNLEPFIKRFYPTYKSYDSDIPEEKYIINSNDSSEIKYKIVVTNFTGNFSKDSLELTNFSGKLLLGK